MASIDLQAVADYLNEGFVNWQAREKHKRSQGDFAKYLNVNEGTLGHWMNGIRAPKGDNVDKIASKLGPKIYDLLGLARPISSRNAEILAMFDELPEEVQVKYKAMLEQEWEQYRRSLEKKSFQGNA